MICRPCRRHNEQYTSHGLIPPDQYSLARAQAWAQPRPLALALDLGEEVQQLNVRNVMS